MKCTYKGCLRPERHDMVCKYLKCECKQVECSLRYQYRHCDSLNEWQLFREGKHPFVSNTSIKKRGVPLQIIKLIEEMLSINPDMKPKEILQTLTSRRKANDILDVEIKSKMSLKENYAPPVQPRKEYLFPKELLPDLTKVINSHFSLLYA